MRAPFLIFALQFGIIIWVTVQYFYIASGKSMRRKTGGSGQDYFFSRRRYKGKGAKAVISAGAPLHNGFIFSVCRLTVWHRFLKSLGLAQDVQTGDPSLDAAFYFMADDEQRLKTLLESQGFVAVLREVFETSEVRNLECRQDKLWFNTGPIINGQTASEETFAGQAARLAQEVEKLEAPDYQPNASSFPLSRSAFLYRVVHVALLILAFVLASTLLVRNEEIINTKDFFLQAASISPIVVLLWLSLLLFIFGKTSWFPQVCGSFVLAGISGLVLLTGLALREADIDLDQAPPDIKSIQLEAKKCSLYCTTGGKNASASTYQLTDQQCSMEAASGTIARYRRLDYRCQHSGRFNYSLFFPWPTERAEGDEGMYEVAARAENYQRAYVGETFTFPLHKGYLGLAWIRKAEIHPE